jgi:hypothetical protein
MGISLTGLTPATTYDALIKVGDNGPIDGTLKVLSDGLGTNLPMEASTTGVNFTGNLTQSGTALQPVLVSGTNIKTINGTSVLGSGNIVTPSTPPSGVSGAIQFSNGSAFASDATNFFWDDTNNRLGIGTNAPASQLEIKGNGDASFQISGGIAGRRALFSYLNAPSVFEFDVSNILRIKNGSTYSLYTDTTGSVGIGTLSPSARTHIKGSGSTSATTALLVQNSAGTEAFRISDDSTILIYGGNSAGFSTNLLIGGRSNTANISFYGNQNIFVGQGGAAESNPSALISMGSTTKGFLPPRGTNTQMNAIASPATGLVFYDTTNNKLCVYNATSWIPLH